MVKIATTSRTGRPHDPLTYGALLSSNASSPRARPESARSTAAVQCSTVGFHRVLTPRPYAAATERHRPCSRKTAVLTANSTTELHASRLLGPSVWATELNVMKEASGATLRRVTCASATSTSQPQ